MTLYPYIWLILILGLVFFLQLLSDIPSVLLLLCDNFGKFMIKEEITFIACNCFCMERFVRVFCVLFWFVEWVNVIYFYLAGKCCGLKDDKWMMTKCYYLCSYRKPCGLHLLYRTLGTLMLWSLKERVSPVIQMLLKINWTAKQSVYVMYCTYEYFIYLL
jgi:hypothetical protein